MILTQKTSTSDGYDVLFIHIDGSIKVVVKYENTLVAESKGWLDHPKAARWARKKIRRHRKALTILSQT